MSLDALGADDQAWAADAGGQAGGAEEVVDDLIGPDAVGKPNGESEGMRQAGLTSCAPPSLGTELDDDDAADGGAGEDHEWDGCFVAPWCGGAGVADERPC